MSTHKCFYGEILQIIPKLSSNRLLICSDIYSKPCCSNLRIITAFFWGVKYFSIFMNHDGLCAMKHCLVLVGISQSAELNPSYERKPFANRLLHSSCFSTTTIVFLIISRTKILFKLIP